MQVLVRDNNVEQALRVLKKKLQKEGVFREMKERRAYEKPSERRVREHAQAVSPIARLPASSCSAKASCLLQNAKYRHGNDRAAGLRSGGRDMKGLCDGRTLQLECFGREA